MALIDEKEFDFVRDIISAISNFGEVENTEIANAIPTIISFDYRGNQYQLYMEMWQQCGSVFSEVFIERVSNETVIATDSIKVPSDDEEWTKSAVRAVKKLTLRGALE